jgi:UDP-glucose 4-epimerase
MRSPTAWVVGEGGFLGSHARRALPREIPGLRAWPDRALRFSWNDPGRLLHELDDAVRAFAAEVGEGPWMVAWCAGAGGVGTSPDALRFETEAFSRFLDLLSTRLPSSGTIGLASSAGGVFGASSDVPLTEASPPLPISDYGIAKLAQEETLRNWAKAGPGRSCLIGRFTNLYGPGQRADRPLGLITRLSWSLLRQKALHVYVSLDTLRDYLWADDGARTFVRCLGRVHAEGGTQIKVLASEQSVSISSILSIFARVTRRIPRTVHSAHALREQQPHGHRFRSTVWRDLNVSHPVGLAEGIHAVHQYQLSLLQTSRRP